MDIKKTIKRLIDDTQYVAALEKQNALLLQNLKQEKTHKKVDEEAQYWRN